MAKGLMMDRHITSIQHPLVKHLVKLRHNRDYRYEHQSLVLEGIKPIEELARQGKFKTLVAYNEAMIPIGAEADSIVIVKPQVMKKISEMEAPEGLIAEISMPKAAKLQGLKKIIALDGVSDPGNLGTLLRTALALGWQGAFVLEGSCDPYNDKALRAARGATFRLPLGFGGLKELKEIVDREKLTPLVADLEGEEVSALQKKDKILLVLGNEAHGASKELRALCTSVTISMPGAMESLNVAVAGGIMMYLLGGR